jgi:hypothetical protein
VKKAAGRMAAEIDRLPHHPIRKKLHRFDFPINRSGTHSSHPAAHHPPPFQVAHRFLSNLPMRIKNMP